jgi:hypothetical protein
MVRSADITVVINSQDVLFLYLNALLQFSISKDGTAFLGGLMGWLFKTDTLTDMTELTDIRLGSYRKKVFKKSFFYFLSL